MAAPLIPLLRQQIVNGNGAPYAGAKLYTYAAGTSTDQATYSDSTLSTPNANPVVADADGRFGSIFLDPALSYKFVLKTSADVEVFSQDNVQTQGSQKLTVLSKSANYTVTVADGEDLLVLADATSGAVTLTLYTSVGNSGRKIHVVKIDSSTNAVTLDPNGSQTINGQTTHSLIAQYARVSIGSDGSNWYVVGASAIPSGAVSTPGLCFEVDTDTGIYRSGANAIDFATAGVKAMGIDSTQFVDSPTQPRCRATKVGAQTISTGTETAVTLTAETYDVGSMHDNVTNSSRITVPTGGDGVYIVTGGCQFASNATNDRKVAIRVNAGNIAGIPETSAIGSASSARHLAATAILTLAAGDYVEMYAWQNSGGNLDITEAHLSAAKMW